MINVESKTAVVFFLKKISLQLLISGFDNYVQLHNNKSLGTVRRHKKALTRWFFGAKGQICCFASELFPERKTVGARKSCSVGRPHWPNRANDVSMKTALHTFFSVVLTLT